MDTTNPYFTRAEVAYRQERARQGLRRARRKSNRHDIPPIGKPLDAEGIR